MLHAHSHDDIPGCWGRPVPDVQGRLFRQSTENVLATLKVSRDDLRRWQQAGWISFDIEDHLEIDEPLISEIEFVLAVARSGLSDAQIDKLFERLPRPFRFRPSEIAFHFAYGWVVPVQDAPFDIIERHLDDWLINLFRNKKSGLLEELSGKIAGHLAVLEAD